MMSFMQRPNDSTMDQSTPKVILVILDGLAFDTSKSCMGYLQALVESNKATLYRLQAELPSSSRPLYETILTGATPVESGVISNNVVRRSNQEGVFSLAQSQGRTTAAAAYHWMSELYNHSPYNPVQDRHTHDEKLQIQHGCFYHEDHYPDSHLFLDAESLRRVYNPDFLLIHSMNIDDAGHKAGFDSTHYRNTARKADVTLSSHIACWISEGYQILITSDHGMNDDKSHGGTLSCERMVPLYVIGECFSHSEKCVPKQTEICGTICQLLGIEHQKSMPASFIKSEVRDDIVRF